MRPPSFATIFALTALALGACDANAEPPVAAEPARASADEPRQTEGPSDSVDEPDPKPVTAASLRDAYPWLSGMDADLQVVPLSQRFNPPAGYSRVSVGEGSFAQFLRGLPVRVDRTGVLSYRGRRLSSPSAAIVAIDVGERNLQQCADSAIRLHAEYLWSRGEAQRLGYHFTSGDETRWEDWQKGERYVISGSKVERVRRGAVANSHAQFRRWLDTVFMYAGTRSLRFDSQPVAGPIAPGDFFVAPGSPGHAVIVLDVARNEDGHRVALLGQGFMPAQDLHVIRSRGDHVEDRVWFVLPKEGEKLATPSWRPFSRGQARRFE
ncbi:hypothetical protein FIV42_05435 [Persicimonas caeni]|uniref:DUF4846 domain-containing protein n=1 Tax=Persicimonas caeni TaxID=2292766 RepID=A0A4Y6PPB7_PERCE|nr:DUF4846 domain-containing protein [Persicimonas caeni]QDG50191.1 hypothetical protein FIV42_05435 [Persicimonas caeni]QED31412.1 hypothetical protein FRD00_05430 [Persicimonas caeni]